MEHAVKIIVSIFLAIFLTSCMSDPAVDLARCVEKQAATFSNSFQKEITGTCDIHQTGSYAAILYPALEISDGQLRESGLDDSSVKMLRSMQLAAPPYESIFIIPLHGQGTPSRTTYQARLVKISKLICKIKKTDELSLKLSLRHGVVEVENIE